MISPPENVVTEAIEAAMRSPCEKSKRGVVIFLADLTETGDGVGIASGYNGMPSGYTCDGSKVCRASCAKRCLHAEDRAIRNAIAANGDRRLHEFEAVHVKVVDGQLVWGGGPSCWQCSRTVLDVGLKAFWLYERVHKECRCPYTDLGEPGTVCPYCDGIWCVVHPELVGCLVRERVEPACSCTPADRHSKLPIAAHWVRYTADEFHRATLEANNLLP